MGGKKRVGRRYSFRIGDALFAPADLSDLSEEVAYNPNNLNASARKVAARVARILGEEVVIVKHLAKNDRDEAIYS